MPCLAWAISANLSVTVVASGIACDIGPNYVGSIPTPAQEAGFTHCVANLDFRTATFTNPNTWLDVFGAANPLLYARSNAGLSHRMPCSDVQMVNDTAGGGASQVLQVSYTMPTDFNNGVDESWISGTGMTNFPHPPGLIFHPGYYAEVNIRVPTNTMQNWYPGTSVHYGNADVWSYPVLNSCNGVGGVPTCDHVMEFDFVEIFASNVANSYDGNYAISGGAGVDPSGVGFTSLTGSAFTNYHTYATLVSTTSSGSPNMSDCVFLDGASVLTGGNKCYTTTYSTVDLKGPLEFYPASMGPQGTSFKPAVTGIMFEQYFTLWSCTGYASGPCYSGSLVTNP